MFAVVVGLAFVGLVHPLWFVIVVVSFCQPNRNVEFSFVIFDSMIRSRVASIRDSNIVAALSLSVFFSSATPASPASFSFSFRWCCCCCSILIRFCSNLYCLVLFFFCLSF